MWVGVRGGLCVVGWRVLSEGLFEDVFWVRLCKGEHVKHTHPCGIGLFCIIPEHLFV